MKVRSPRHVSLKVTLEDKIEQVGLAAPENRKIQITYMVTRPAVQQGSDEAGQPQALGLPGSRTCLAPGKGFVTWPRRVVSYAGGRQAVQDPPLDSANPDLPRCSLANCEGEV
jgi:hypothetical protein